MLCPLKLSIFITLWDRFATREYSHSTIKIYFNLNQYFLDLKFLVLGLKYKV